MRLLLALTICIAFSQTIHAADPLSKPTTVERLTTAGDAEGLAKKLANPVASLVSVPFQLNYDTDIGPEDKGSRWMLNVQPVIPFSLSEDWNLISRTILPVIWQDDIFAGAGSQSGIGDLVQSLFFSTKDPSSSGWIWSVGPVFLLPTGSNELLTADKWGAGPTAVALKQQGPWIYGVLANHIWSFAGDDGRQDVRATFMQPFLTFTNKRAFSVTAMTESTYDWAPIVFFIRMGPVVVDPDCGCFGKFHGSPPWGKGLTIRVAPKVGVGYPVAKCKFEVFSTVMGAGKSYVKVRGHCQDRFKAAYPKIARHLSRIDDA